MNLTRRDLLKTAGAAAIAGAAGSLFTPQRSFAHSADLIDQELDIIMGDIFFQPVGGEKGEAIRVKAGTTVRFTFRNDGAVVHDAHFGLEPDLEKRLYAKTPFQGFDMLELDPGSVAKLTLSVPADAAGTWEIGCFQPGHYEGGMLAPFIIE